MHHWRATEQETPWPIATPLSKRGAGWAVNSPSYARPPGRSQHALAPLTHYARSTIANVEVGRQHVPRAFWQLCDDVLGADGTLIRGYDELQALIRRHHEQIARALRETAEERARIGPSQQQGAHAHCEVPFDPMRRRTLVTWGLTTAAAGGLDIASVGAVGATDVGRLQRTEAIVP
jgi:hypothetical protein